MLIGNPIFSNAQKPDNQIERMAEEYRNIKDAEASGADISSLIVEYNRALDLRMQADSNDYRTCPDYETCVKESKEMFASVETNSVQFREQAKIGSDYSMIWNLVLAPIASFVVSFIALYGYRTWKSYMLDRFLGMKVIVNKE
jgi:hypothetical protein